jgi:hypothetical protein
MPRAQFLLALHRYGVPMIDLSEEELQSDIANASEEEQSGKRPSAEHGQGKASEWLRTATGSVHVAAGETADDARMSYYAGKYGLTP